MLWRKRLFLSESVIDNAIFGYYMDRYEKLMALYAVSISQGLLPSCYTYLVFPLLFQQQCCNAMQCMYVRTGFADTYVSSLQCDLATVILHTII